MKKKIFAQVALVCFFLVMPLVSYSAQRPNPTEQMKPFVRNVMKILKDADSKEDPKCIICQRLINVFRERFDFHEMSKRVLGRSWRKLSKEERDDFVDLFTRLLQYAYIGKLEKYTDQKVLFKGQRIRGKRAEVQTEINDGQQSVAVSYIMLLEDDQWMVYDVIIEGVSLIRNYMEQFKEILRKEKYSGLVKQIEKKVKDLETERRQRFLQNKK